MTGLVLHDTMPVILRRESFEDWLRPDAELEALQAMLVPISGDAMERYPISRDVNSSWKGKARHPQAAAGLHREPATRFTVP